MLLIAISFCFWLCFLLQVTDKDYSFKCSNTLSIVIGFSIYLKFISIYTARGAEIKSQTEQLKQNLLNYSLEVNSNTINL
jgi:hypothetical protein